MLPVTIEPINPTVAACEELAALISPVSKLEVRPIANLEELRRLHEIDADAYQECSISFECFAGWWKRYPEGITTVFSGSDIVASIGMWAISPDQIERFVNGDIREIDLLPVTLEECDTTPQSIWYASGIVLRKDLRGKIRSNPIKLMLQVAIANWVDCNRAAYPLKVFALGEYLAGQNILNRFNFEKIRDGEDLPDGCGLYCLEVNTEKELEKILKSRNL